MKPRFTIAAVVALCLIDATGAQVASAETTLLAEWLADGNAITSNLGSEVIGAFKLEDSKAPIIGVAAVKCGMILRGTVGANGVGAVSEVLNLGKEAIGELSGLALLGEGAGTDCQTVSGCAEGSAASPIEVWPVGLPWRTELFLMENGAFLDLITATSVGYEVLCLVLGENTEDTCTATDTEALIENSVSAERAVIPTGSQIAPDLTCSLGGAGSGIVEATETTRVEQELKVELFTVSST